MKTLIIDNFLNDDDPLFKCIRNDMLWKNKGPLDFMSSEANPTNIWEKMAVHIWTCFNESHGKLPDYEGIEYWNNTMFSYSGCLPWHRDKDEELWNTKNILSTPYIGSVYYAHDVTPIGGNLEIIMGEEVESISPLPNRLVVFDSSRSHRVTAVENGLRKSFITNIWTQRPNGFNQVL